MKVILISLVLLSISTQAHWFGLNCSSADQSVSYTESKMGMELIYVKESGEKETITSDFSDNVMVLDGSDKAVMNNVDERSCVDNLMSYFISQTYAINATISFENDTLIFPAGSNVSEDGKSVNVPMICEYVGGGASSCVSE